MELVTITNLALTDSDIARFWAKVDKSADCWEWTASRNAGGYGQMALRQNGRIVTPLAHRISYTISGGQIPSGQYIDHACHNRACVRPSHLRLATLKQNPENRAGASSNSQTGVRGVHPAMTCRGT